MAIENIPDWEKRLERQDAFWDQAVLDRPLVCLSVPNPDPARPVSQPRRTYTSDEERWLDFEAYALSCVAAAGNTLYLGDALPHFWPNLGPDIFAAFLGCNLRYGDWTTWSEPCLHDWTDVEGITFSRDNRFFQLMDTFTDVMLEAGKGLYYTGLTDLHPGGDALAALRDPQELGLDMIDHVEEVKKLQSRVSQIYMDVFDHFHARLTAAGQAISTWAGPVSSRKWYVPSNDFSCMVSKEMFDDVFLPGIAEECRFLDASVYHLDGPGALRHLDSLLSIPELNAIQWVYGAGNGRASDWLDVYKRCQAAGKGVEIGIGADELETFIEALKPEGVWLSVGVQTREEADTVVKRVAAWT